MLQYADLDIRILPLEDEGYPVELTLDGQRQYARGYADPGFLPWTPSLAPEQDGRQLFEWLFADPALRSAWDEVRGAHPQRRIRLRIDADAPALHSLPWEILRAPEGKSGLPLAASSSTPFSRYLAGPWDPGAAIPQRPIKIAVAIAAPDNLVEYGLAPIDAAHEWEALQETLGGVDAEIVQVPQPCTPAALEAAVKDGCHILHFVGHGAFARQSEEAALFLADDDNRVRPVREQELAAMLARQLIDVDNTAGRQLRLVFLAACESATRSPADAFRGLAPSLVRAGVPAVVAMQDLVTVETARAFSASFYRQLMKHGLVDLACNEARAAILTRNLPGASVPVLFMRLEMGVLLDMPAALEPRRWSAPFWSVAVLTAVVIVATAISVSLPNLLAGQPSPTPSSAPALPTATPTLTPLTGTFNVALMRFAEEGDDGLLLPSSAGSVYSQSIFAALQAEFAANQPLLGEGVQVEGWLAPADLHVPGVDDGVILGGSEAERAQIAARLADELDAQMVIYGYLARGGEAAQLEVEFYVAPEFGEEVGQIAGRYTLGDGVTVPADPAGLDRISVARLLGQRAEALAGVTIGLILDLLGDHENALMVFGTLAADLDQDEQASIAQLLDYFIGRQQLFLGHLDEAESTLRRAVDANPASARAHIVLGSVFLKRAGEQMAAQGGPATELVEEALRHYQLAMDNAAGDELVEQSSRLALGSAYVVAGQSAYLGDDLAGQDPLSAACRSWMQPRVRWGRRNCTATAWCGSLRAMPITCCRASRFEGDTTERKTNLEQRLPHISTVSIRERSPSDDAHGADRRRGVAVSAAGRPGAGVNWSRLALD